MRTPGVHFKMAEWLEKQFRAGKKRLLLMAFRSSGKSTVVGLFAAWLLYQNPNLRILVLAADAALAGKMVRNVKRIIERHPLTVHLKPEKLDQWASDRFTVVRDLELRDPSVLASGVQGNITGNRADIILCDDVEVPNTCDTADKRLQLREALAELSYVKVDQSALLLYIGTPHTFESIYAQSEGPKDAFLEDFQRFELPLLDDDGKSIWPERFSDDEVLKLRTQVGPNRFDSQMMLRPVNLKEGRLNPDLLRVYDDPLDYTPELKSLFLGRHKLVSVSAFWDPSFASATGDRSVLAAVFADDCGRYFLHRVLYLPVQKAESESDDEATRQCKFIADAAKELMLPSVTLEINGIGKFLPAILRNVLSENRVPCRVVEFANSKPKALRILEAFDAILAARKLYVHSSVMSGPFVNEMREWQPEYHKGHDDGLDAAAGALALQPIRLPRMFGRGGYEWHRGAGTHIAKSDFKL